MAVQVAAVIGAVSAVEKTGEAGYKAVKHLTENNYEASASEVRNAAETDVKAFARAANSWGKTAETTKDVAKDVTEVVI